MQKKINIFLLITIFLCSFTLSSCESKSYLAHYYDLEGLRQEFIIENKETYELRVDEFLYIDLEEEGFNHNSLKIKIKANEEYFKINEYGIKPIKECDNEKVVVYSGIDRVTFYVNATKIDKYVDLEVEFHPHPDNSFSINYNSMLPFFILSNYDIDNVIVGDIIRMHYSGEYSITEAMYDNVWCGGKLINLEIVHEAIPYTFIIDENYVPIIKDSDIEYTFHRRVNILEKYNVIIDDEKYTTTDTLELGQVLYGFTCVNNPNEIVSLYSYNPNA